jgi:hypothetical protein
MTSSNQVTLNPQSSHKAKVLEKPFTLQDKLRSRNMGLRGGKPVGLCTLLCLHHCLRCNTHAQAMCMLGCPESRFQRCSFRLLCCVVSCRYGMWGLCFAVPSHVHPATPVPLLNAQLCSSSQCNTQGILLTLLTARSLPRRIEAPPTAVMRTRLGVWSGRFCPLKL